MAKGGGREQVARGAALGVLHLPAQATRQIQAGRMATRHQRQRRRLQKARAVGRQPGEHGTAKLGQVLRVGKQARMAGDAAHYDRVFVMHLADHHTPAPRAVLRGSDARMQRLRGIKAGVAHLQRFENQRGKRLVQRHAGRCGDGFADEHEALRGILHRQRRKAARRHGAHGQQHVLLAMAGMVQLHLSMHGAGMGQQRVHAHAALGISAIGGQKAIHRIVQADFALFQQAHKAHGDNRLGDRGQIVQRLLRRLASAYAQPPGIPPRERARRGANLIGGAGIGARFRPLFDELLQFLHKNSPFPKNLRATFA